VKEEELRQKELSPRQKNGAGVTRWRPQVCETADFTRTIHLHQRTWHANPRTIHCINASATQTHAPSTCINAPAPSHPISLTALAICFADGDRRRACTSDERERCRVCGSVTGERC
jgi:hypothetical protein